jgi:hypothetical protein
MVENISFEPAHFKNSFGIIIPDRQIVVDGRKYCIEEFNSESAAGYNYGHEISRLTSMEKLPYCTHEIRLADSILEYFFNSERIYSLDEQKDACQIGMFRRLFATGKVDKYIVLPRENQIEEVLGLGYHSIRRKTGLVILGKKPSEIEETCKLYKDHTDWKFRIAAKIAPSQIEKEIATQSNGEVTLRLSSKEFRFSVN